MLSEKTGWTRCTLVERVFLFYPEEDREDEEETLLKLLYEVETRGEGTEEVTRGQGAPN